MFIKDDLQIQDVHISSTITNKTFNIQTQCVKLLINQGKKQILKSSFRKTQAIFHRVKIQLTIDNSKNTHSGRQTTIFPGQNFKLNETEMKTFTDTQFNDLYSLIVKILLICLLLNVYLQPINIFTFLFDILVFMIHKHLKHYISYQN